MKNEKPKLAAIRKSVEKFLKRAEWKDLEDALDNIEGSTGEDREGYILDGIMAADGILHDAKVLMVMLEEMQ